MNIQSKYKRNASDCVVNKIITCSYCRLGKEPASTTREQIIYAKKL